MRLLIIGLTVAVIGVFAPISKAYSDYYYCNMYVDTLCFGVIRGDVLTMQIPVDFVLYDIKFHAGGNIQIYYGDNPKKIEENEVLIKKERDIDVGEISLYKLNEDQYRITYRKADERMKGRLDPTVDIHINGITEDNYSKYNDFLHNFTPCKMNDKGAICSEKSVFGNKLFQKKMFRKR